MDSGNRLGSGKDWDLRGFYYCGYGGHYVKHEEAKTKSGAHYCPIHGSAKLRLRPRTMTPTDILRRKNLNNVI